MFTAVGEGQFATKDEVFDRARNEDLSRPRKTRDARREGHSESGDVVAAALDLAGMQAGSQLQAHFVGFGAHPFCAAYALGRAGEQREDTVTSRLDRLTAMRVDDRPR